ncbi:hypothetical protein D3C71_1836590 [compost metagenome]
MYVIIKAELPEELLMPDLNDVPDAKTWEDSDREAAQVCVLGSVSVNQMVGLIIIMRDLHKEIETTFDNWKVDLKRELALSVKRGYYDVDDCYELWDRLGIPNSSNG